METEASQQVTDEMLDRAAEEVETVEEVEETEVEEEVVDEEVVPEEPEDNSERSKLGRKVKTLEQLLESEREERSRQSQQLNETLEKLSKYLAPKEEEEIFEFPETKEQFELYVEKMIEQREEKRKSQTNELRTRYEKEYISALDDLLEEEPDRDAILEVFDQFNYKHTENGYKDAAKNILKAKNSLKKVPLKGDKPRGMGGGANTTPEKKKVMPKLSPDAAEYARRNNMTEEQIIEALS